MDKTKIQDEICQISNNILNKYDDEPYEVDSISIINARDKIIFLGHLRVFNERNIKKILKELESELSKIGKLDISERRIIPCCSLPYNQISFHITFNRE